MQLNKKKVAATKLQLTLVADEEQLKTAKQKVLKKAADGVHVPGFRAGKAPLNLVEKQVNAATLQTDFLDEAINLIYTQALQQDNDIRPVAQPSVSITKFVPFTTLEAQLEVEVVGEVKLADYKKIKLTKKPVTVTPKEIDAVIEQMRTRGATAETVDRPAKDGDRVVITFTGSDTKTKEPIKGADGTDYPLLLGSNTFIPGFEAHLIGLKAGGQKTFDIKFPKDYGVKSLQDRNVSFAVTVSKVDQLTKPEIDDHFAAKVGPFKTVDAMKTDIKQQLRSDKQERADSEFIDELLTKVTAASTVVVPDILIDEQVDRMVREQQQNVAYRGQTWTEYLEAQDLDETKYRQQIRSTAELRVKAGLVLGQIAELEKIVVHPEELETRLQELKQRYPDGEMRAELDKPAARREILGRLVSEKAADKLVEYATA